MSNFKAIRFAHALDAAWIIALWKAIHWGDPPPEQIAIEAIAALSGTLAGHAGATPPESSFTELQRRLKEIGVEIEEQANAHEQSTISNQPRIPRTYCVVFKGQRVCITLPQPSIHPQA
jgi:hypothetical protein